MELTDNIYTIYGCAHFTSVHWLMLGWVSHDCFIVSSHISILLMIKLNSNSLEDKQCLMNCAQQVLTNHWPHFPFTLCFHWRLLQGLWESLKQGIWSRAPSSGQFYKLRLLFLLTALRPELRLQLSQVNLYVHIYGRSEKTSSQHFSHFLMINR